MTAPSDDSENIADTEEIRGMNALLGMELVEWRDGYARTEIEVGAKHLNHGGLVHGGLSLALLDVTSVYTGYWAPRDQERARCVTLSLTTNFIGKAPTGGRLVCEAWRDGGGRSIFFARGEVRDAAGELVATSKSTHRVRSGSR